ncbi:Zona pellucida-like domain containing protein [Aphelenchoides avenae]|nr:Zona pellucida-like domain containing protein [Aphelenchus avenae]
MFALGSPTVACEREFIRFSVPTRKPFRGRVYVKGEYGKDECVRNYVSGSQEAGGSVGVEHQPPYSRARPPGGHESPRFPESARRWKEYFGGDRATRVRPDANGECPLTCPPCEECRDSAVWRAVGPRTRRQAEDNEAALEIQLGTCNLRRDRTATPPGIQMSLTVVVSFHDSFITRVDRAYQVVCAYEEHEHTVTYKMDIENPPEQNLGGEGVLPRCEYRITAPSGRGQIANVRVGDQVEHTWRCATDFAPPEGLSDKYGVLVHSCYLEDGNGRRELILNDKGCTLQPAVMGTPAYSKRSLEASVSTLVVKFPDRDFVGFQCTISVCMKEIGNCEGVTVIALKHVCNNVSSLAP